MPALDFNVLKGLAKRKKKDERGFYCHVFSRVNPVATVLRRRRQGFSAHKKMKRLPVLLTINKVFIAKQRAWQRSDDLQNISVSFITSFMSVCCCPTSIPARDNDAIDPIRTKQRFQKGVYIEPMLGKRESRRGRDEAAGPDLMVSTRSLIPHQPTDQF